jgi:hypothetical protein
MLLNKDLKSSLGFPEGERMHTARKVLAFIPSPPGLTFAHKF